MNKNFHHTEFVECYLLQFVHQVGLIDLISSPIKFCLFSCRMSEKTKFIPWVQKEISCNFPGQDKTAFPDDQKLFLLPRHKFGPSLVEMYNRRESISCRINNKANHFSPENLKEF